MYTKDHQSLMFGSEYNIVFSSFSSLQGERATGYGVSLLATLFGEDSTNSLLQYVAPPLVENPMDIEENEVKKIRLV